MKFISGVLYFLNNHAAWSAVIIFTICFLLAYWRKKWGYSLMAFLLPIANLFLANHLNALFLNAFGEKGTGVVTQVTQLNATYNDQYVHEFDVVVKTAGGKDVVTSFTTQSASIYPLRNRILIPPTGQPFVLKYIPGYEKNMVILSDESLYGQMQKIYDNQQPVDKAARQYEASPANGEFKQEYLRELKDFVNNPENTSDTVTMLRYRTIISTLEN